MTEALRDEWTTGMSEVFSVDIAGLEVDPEVTDANALSALSDEAKQRPEWTWDESADKTRAWLVNGERQP